MLEKTLDTMFGVETADARFDMQMADIASSEAREKWVTIYGAVIIDFC
jgi:hypothetical protein